MGGFAKIKRGSNTCGIATCASFPINVLDPEREGKRLFQRHLHNVAETGAYCLDGSPGGLYYSKGWGSGKNKTVIHFKGGAWCMGPNTTAVLEDCF
jgi:hypothetical protein